MPGSAPPSAGPPKQLAIGVVGLGRIGRQHALNALHHVPRTKLVCACSPMDHDVEWAQRHLAPWGVSVYRTVDDMLQHPGLDALLIASSTHVHHEHVLAGMAKGLHVLCEKPLAMNSEQSRKILDVARQPQHSGVKIMTAFSRRFDASYQNARAAIEAGRIGRPVMIRCDNRDKYDRSEFYMRYITANPGIFIDTAIHDIDLTLSFLGARARPKSAHAIGTIALHHELAPIRDVDNAVGTVEWHLPGAPGEHGTSPIASYTVSRIMHHGFDNPTEIVGTDGVLKINLHPRRDLVEVADQNGIGNSVMPDFYERYEKAFVAELAEFADCVLDEKPLPYALETAVLGMEVAEALQESLRTGKKIEWDPSGRRI